MMEVENEFLPSFGINDNGVTFRQIQEEGVVIDTDDNNHEDLEEYFDELPWTRDQVPQHLDDEEHENPTAIPPVPFDEMIADMTRLTEDDGVYKKIIKNGSGEVISEGIAISYHCEAFLEGKDEPFDSSVLRQRPYYHRLNEESSMVAGLFVALKTMRKGEVAFVIIRPNYAFGELGVPPRVPGGATILYKVEVLRVVERGTLANYMMLSEAERSQVPYEEVLKMCNDERILGNTYFKQKQFKESVFRYRKAIQVLEYRVFTSEEEENLANDLLLKLYTNAANGYNILHKHFAAMSMCKRALNIQPHNLKAIYHYAKAKRYNGEYEVSKQLLLTARAINPKVALIANELRTVEERIAIESIKEKELMRKMSGGILG